MILAVPGGLIFNLKVTFYDEIQVPLPTSLFLPAPEGYFAHNLYLLLNKRFTGLLLEITAHATIHPVLFVGSKLCQGFLKWITPR